MTQSKVETAMRAAGFAAALAIAGWLAVMQQNEVAAGAIIALLGSASSFLFRGKVEKS